MFTLHGVWCKHGLKLQCLVTDLMVYLDILTAIAMLTPQNLFWLQTHIASGNLIGHEKA